MKMLTGHQPNYLPYPGVFSKILRADGFVIVDHVQIVRRSEHKRNLIRRKDGPLMLSLQITAPYQSSMTEVRLVDTRNVLKSHWTSIEQAYSKYPFFDEYADRLKTIYDIDYEYFADFTRTLIICFLSCLGIDKPVYISSHFMTPELHKNEMIIEMCRLLGYNGYISGMGAKDYIEEDKFSAAGLKHQFNEYVPIKYDTPIGPSSTNMCILDPLFSVGGPGTTKLLQKELDDRIRHTSTHEV